MLKERATGLLQASMGWSLNCDRQHLPHGGRVDVILAQAEAQLLCDCKDESFRFPIHATGENSTLIGLFGPRGPPPMHSFELFHPLISGLCSSVFWKTTPGYVAFRFKVRLK